MPTPADPPMTLDEHLAFEEPSDLRHEPYAGRVFALAGSDERHTLIRGNLY